MSQNIEFTIPFEARPEKPIEMTLYAFDERGNKIASASIINNLATLQLSEDQAKKSRLVIAPSPPKELLRQEVTFDNIQRRQPFVVPWRFDPSKKKYTLPPVSLANLKLWLWCPCKIQGKVVKKVAVGTAIVDMPIYLAKVHICEVDPFWLILKRLPDLQIVKIRDEIIKAIGKPIPQPPQPDPKIDPDVLDYSATNIARMYMKLPIRKKTALVRAAPVLRPRTQNLTLPPETVKQLKSESPVIVRQTLITNVQLIHPFICFWNWLWPFYLLHCDEIATVLTDQQGAFQTNIWYLCNGDHPDIYFWVEYQVGGAWTTVYHPSIYCTTRWNYPCGTEVTIPITDPRVPWYPGQEQIPGKQVAILSIGHDISMTEIKRSSAGAQEGLTNANEPFGESLEPTVWFGDAIASSGITHYRWSCRKIANADGSPVAVEEKWRVLDRKVIRHYGEILADDTLTFKPYLLGPDPDIAGDTLFKIPPRDPPLVAPAVSSTWAPMVDARENTASAFFLSHLEGEGNPMEGAGRYELKLELFRYAGTTPAVPLNLSDEGVKLKVPTVDAPFGLGSVPTTDVANYPAMPTDMEDRVIRDASKKITAFRLVLHVDNNPCEAIIYPVKEDTPPGTWATKGACGFIKYPPGAKVNISFKAAHPNNFATFSFVTWKGSSGPVHIACAPEPAATSLPTVSNPNVNNFLRAANSVYSKTIDVKAPPPPPGQDPTSLVDTCPNGTAAFSENLAVYPLATNGWTTLWYLERFATDAFALQPQ